jgi:hypothetical protein
MQRVRTTVLGIKCPAEVYQPSTGAYQGLADIDYPFDDVERRATQHVRLFAHDDAYRCLYILTLLPSLVPLRLMPGKYTMASRFRSEGFAEGPNSSGIERGNSGWPSDRKTAGSY